MKNRCVILLQDDSGWTFIETLIVIGIIVILTGSVGFVGMKYIEQAKVASAKNEIRAFSLAIESYYLDNFQYPTDEQGLEALWERPTTEPVPENWSGPYVNKMDFLDPWKNPYDYQFPGEMDLPFTIASYGADKYLGGEELDQDILSWE